MSYFAHFLLLVSAGFFGLAFRNLTLGFLGRFARYQQEVRLQNLAGNPTPGSKKLPFQTLVALVDRRLAPYLKADHSQKYMRYLSKQLSRMNRADLKPNQIIGYQVLLALAAGSFFGSLSGSLELALIALGVGFALPWLWLRDGAMKRENLLLRELPNALEILSLCSEAGLSLEQSLDQYLKNAKKGPLHEEFSRLLEQTRTGSSRKNALQSINSRLGLVDFSLFATGLIHAEKFGTGISQTLRQLSITMRDKQSQRAEKAVQEMPVKMLIPLILFIMPVTFIIIFGPVLLQFIQP